MPDGRCPNCGGELVRWPVRPPATLAKYPASTERVVNRTRGVSRRLEGRGALADIDVALAA